MLWSVGNGLTSLKWTSSTAFALGEKRRPLVERRAGCCCLGTPAATTGAPGKRGAGQDASTAAMGAEGTKAEGGVGLTITVFIAAVVGGDGGGGVADGSPASGTPMPA